jgi:membrane-bound lytic murein transglycosylase D
LIPQFKKIKKEEFMQQIIKQRKVILSFGLLMILALVMQLFTFSARLSDDEYKLLFKSKYNVYALEVPKDLSFANEKMPLYDFEVFERMDRELLINTYWQTQTILIHKRANRWLPIIEPILKRNGIPDDFKYIPVVETGFLNLTSPAGAVGFWQFMENTAREYGLEVNAQVDERYHVEKSTQAACDYFNKMYKELGNWTMVAAAYNMGLTGVKTQINRQGTKNYYDLVLNQETSRYVFRIVAMKEIMEHSDDYGYRIRKKDMYPLIPTYTVKVDTAITDMAQFATRLNINYKTIKTFNPWLREAFLQNQENKVYYIQIPKIGYDASNPFDGR